MAGEPHLIPRLTPGGQINLDGRTGAIGSDTGSGQGGGGTPGGGSGGTTVSTLLITVTPLQIEPGAGASATIAARTNGVPVSGVVVTVTSSNGAVAPVPATVTTGSDGNAVFSINGGVVGSSLIGASATIGGAAVAASPVTLGVATQAPNVNYNTTGYGRVVLTIETPMSNARVPRVQRLSNAEQIRKYPDDEGLKWATHFETATITLTKAFAEAR